MTTDVNTILSEHKTPIEETIYKNSGEEFLARRMVSGDFFTLDENHRGEKKIRFKNSVDLVDFKTISMQIPKLFTADFPGREASPFFVENLESLSEAIREKRPIAVEGGPCLFGNNEVEVEVLLENGSRIRYDYCSGKRFEKESDRISESMEEPLKDHGQLISGLCFHDKKEGLTSQEYESIRILFESAKALYATLVITIPDMSYLKYLQAVAGVLKEDVREKALLDFTAISDRICDLYLKEIEGMKKEYPTVSCLVFHRREKKLCETFLANRAPYLERNKVLRSITGSPERLESIKDYISMPALPFYLLGIRDILEINSVDEVDSFRKCKKANKSAVNLSCILYPEKLSRDGEHTIYQAKREWKEYR